MSAILNQTPTIIFYQYSRAWPEQKGYRTNSRRGAEGAKKDEKKIFSL